MTDLSRRNLLGLLAGAAALRALPARAAIPERDDVIGRLTDYVVEGEETLLEVAMRYNTGVPQISALNPGIDPWVPGRGTRVTLPTMHVLPDAAREGIVINKADLRLYFWPKVGPLQDYAIGVGKEGFNTPIGPTRIARKRLHPTWIPTAASLNEKPWLPRVVPPGPDNPLGDYAMDLGFPGSFLLHSTNKPYGVGRRVSHGCIRLYPSGMERLFPQVPVGQKVTIVEQYAKVGWHQGELYLEVQPSLAQIDELEASYRMTADPYPDPTPLVVAKAGPELHRVDWDLVHAEAAARRGIPVQITRGDEQRVAEDSLPALPAAPPAAMLPVSSPRPAPSVSDIY